MRLIISSEFAKKKQEFKLKKIKKPIYVRNVDSFFNRKGPIEYTVEVNIYYQKHRERTEINVIEEQKQKVILEISQLVYYNFEIDQNIEKVKMMRCPKECGKQQRPKQEKSEQQKQSEEENNEEKEKEQEKKKEEKKKKSKNGKMMMMVSEL